MSYTINLTNGNVFAVVADGTINTQSSMTLIGKNYAGYGQFIDDNFIHLLENSANATAPTAPLVGQLWWDSTGQQLKVWNGNSWKAANGATNSPTAPTSNAIGDLWFDTTNQQLKVWNGTAWILVGPPYSSGEGITGSIPATIVDTLSNSHTVLQEYVGNTIVAMVSKDATFTPQTPIPGFTTINPGYTLASTVGVGNNVPLFNGTASNSLLLGGLPASAFLSSSGGNATITGNLIVTGNETISGNLLIGQNLQITTSLGVGLPNAAFSGVNGEIRAANNITAFYTSDSRFKENIQDISGALSKVDCIGGKTFDWKDDYIAEHGGVDGYFVQKSDFGVIAQDVQKVFPTAVRTKPDGTLAVDYEKLSALAFAAIRELNAKVDALIAKLDL